MARLVRGVMLVSVLCTMPAVLGQAPELAGQAGYKYFGAAKDLPGVR